MQRPIALVLVLVVSTLGCSRYFVSGPNQPPEPPGDCTQSNFMPVVDTVIAGVLGIAAVGILVLASDDDRGDDEQTGLAVGGILYGLGAVGMAGSAFAGYDKTARCRRAHQQYEQHLLRPQPQPGLQPQPSPYPYPTAPAPSPYPYPTAPTPPPG